MQIKELVKTDFIRIDKNATVSELIGELKQEHQRNALMFDGEKFLGIISKRGLLKSKVMADKMKITGLARQIATIKEEADVLEAAYLMFNVDTNILPVERDGKIIGVLSIFDLLNQIKDYEEIKHMKISEVKLQPLKIFKETTRVDTIIDEMHKFNTYEMPIVDGNGQLRGLISISDIFNKFVGPVTPSKERRMRGTKTMGFESDKADVLGLPISGFGTLRDVFFEDINERVIEVVREMTKHNVMGIVVMKDKKPVGMVTANNLLRLMASIYKEKEYNIQLTGLKKTDLEGYQAANLQKILTDHAAVLYRLVKNKFLLEVQVKEHGQAGKKDKKHKWVVKMKIVFPGVMVASEDYDWDIETAVHKSFDNLKKRLQTKFKANVRGWKKPYE